MELSIVVCNQLSFKEAIFCTKIAHSLAIIKKTFEKYGYTVNLLGAALLFTYRHAKYEYRWHFSQHLS